MTDSRTKTAKVSDGRNAVKRDWRKLRPEFRNGWEGPTQFNVADDTLPQRQQVKLRCNNGIRECDVSQCANPDCRLQLHYLREGKIYRFALSAKTGGNRLEHFWLCGECSKSMILTCVNRSEVKTVRLIHVSVNQPGSVG
jgi:hypothetical protein